jgi:hypothetical protein
MSTASYPKIGTGAAAIAEKIISEKDSPSILAYARQLRHDRDSTIIKAARVLDEVVSRKPEMGTGVVSTLVQGLFSSHPRVVQMSATALPAVARVSPAKVAKHLVEIQENFQTASEAAQTGIVRTYVALCLASVSYQRKLEHVFQQLLTDASAEQLAVWSDILLPALKGEPYASCRAIVEDRLERLPRDLAHGVAMGLGIKLRPAMAG